MIYLTRRERFNAAHRMYREEWSDEKNYEVFGKCSNPNWHGHNYELFVTVRGKPDPHTGLLINLKEVSRIIREYVIDRLDHKNINLEVNFMQGKIASTENLAMAIWDVLEPHFKSLGVALHTIQIKESENNIVKYQKDK